MEIKLTELNHSDNFVIRAKEQLGNDEGSPNWDRLEEITVGIAHSVSGNFNIVLWQGSQFWILSQVFNKTQQLPGFEIAPIQ